MESNECNCSLAQRTGVVNRTKGTEFFEKRREYKKGMKILFLTDSITTLGGAQRVTSIIANELSKSNNITGYKVSGP